MTAITIRTATREDMPYLLRFEQGLITAERPFDITIREGDIRYYDIDNMIQAPHIHLVVAELDQVPVGCGYARIEAARHYLLHKQHAYLGFMYVEPMYRGQGINQKVMEELKRWTARQGLTEMILDVYYDNNAAIAAYEKAGFSRHLITMRCDLRDKR